MLNFIRMADSADNRPARRVLCLFVLLLALTGTRSAVDRLAATLGAEDARTVPLSTSNDGSAEDKRPRPSRRYHDLSLTQPVKARISALIPASLPPIALHETNDAAFASDGLSSARAEFPWTSLTTPAYLNPFRRSTPLGSLAPPLLPGLQV
jgi:hypothetical protein